MKKFDFNKIPEVLNFMEDNDRDVFTTQCGVEFMLVREGNIITYSMHDSEGRRVIDDNRELFIKRCTDYFLGGGRD